MSITVRAATLADAPLIHRFIVALAEYEREPDAVESTPELIAEQLAAEPPPFECLIAELGGAPAGFAVFFHDYSTWRGKQGLYLEDLYVPEALRGRGVGKALLVALAKIAEERGCARMNWAVLDWNQPAIDFYRSLGAEPLGEWTTFRLSGAALKRLARGC